MYTYLLIMTLLVTSNDGKAFEYETYKLAVKSPSLHQCEQLAVRLTPDLPGYYLVSAQCKPLR